MPMPVSLMVKCRSVSPLRPLDSPEGSEDAVVVGLGPMLCVSVGASSDEEDAPARDKSVCECVFVCVCVCVRVCVFFPDGEMKERAPLRPPSPEGSEDAVVVVLGPMLCVSVGASSDEEDGPARDKCV